MLDRLLSRAGDTLHTWADLVVPSPCAGCEGAAPFTGVCAGCASALADRPGPTRPTPAPDGLPPCLTLGEYRAVLRELILGYKERDRRRLVAPLGDALAGVVLAGLPPRSARGVVLVPVPATGAAIRARQGDHMLRLARRAARRLREACPTTVAPVLRALPKEDSAHLDRHARARVALGSFTARRGADRIGRGDLVVVVDDVITTGSTVAAVTTRLAERGVVVAFAATLAATRLRRVGSLAPNEAIPWDGSWNWG